MLVEVAATLAMGGTFQPHKRSGSTVTNHVLA